MSWETRILTSAYWTSPSGEEFELEYKDVEESYTKNNTRFSFPRVNLEYVQVLSYSSTEFPLDIFFSGDDYDLEVQAFLDATLENGFSVLEHPVYGKRNVQILRIGREDNITTGANTTRLRVLFVESLIQLFPVQGVDNKADAEAASERQTLQSAGVAGDNVNLDLTDDKVSFQERVRNTVDIIKKPFEIADDVVRKIEDLLLSPVDNLFQIVFELNAAIKAPIRSGDSFLKRADGYTELAGQFADGALPPSSGGSSNGKNSAYEAESYAYSSVAGLAETCVNLNEGDLTTKAEALNAANLLAATAQDALNALDDTQAEYENELPENAYIRDHDAALELAQSIASALRFLIEQSINLAQERSFILEESSALIPLVYMVYGDVEEETVQKFIDDNVLEEDELIYIEQGKELVYFV